jgi:hypothetical protein
LIFSASMRGFSCDVGHALYPAHHAHPAGGLATPSPGTPYSPMMRELSGALSRAGAVDPAADR